MADIPCPWRFNIGGATKPYRQKFPAAVGTTRTIDKGAMCYMATGDSDLVEVSAATDNLYAIVVADEAQLATHPERFIWCIVPRPDDVFEFDLDAATLVYFGLECQIASKNTLKVSATDPIASVADTSHQQAETGATQPTVASVRVAFKRAGVVGASLDLPILGSHVGDAT